jgi:hypothetical protein
MTPAQVALAAMMRGGRCEIVADGPMAWRERNRSGAAQGERDWIATDG